MTTSESSSPSHVIPPPTGAAMIVGAQMRAARALLGLGQRDLHRLSELSLRIVQTMKSSSGLVRAVVDSLGRGLTPFARRGVDLIADGAPSAGLSFCIRRLQWSERRAANHVA
jgi:hypothetical protein